MPPTTRPRRLAALLLALPLAAVLGACGAAGAADDPEPDPAAQHEAPGAASFEEYQLAFAACMRDKGVDMPDPDSDGLSVGGAGDAFLEAAAACRTELGAPPARDGDTGGGLSQDALRKEHLEIAACLREHGVDVTDPAPGEDLGVPGDVPSEVFETCAPRGVVGSTGGTRR